MRPFFPYYGSKWNIARYYPAPEHNLVIEPFAGGAGYATFHGAKQAHLYDADPVIAGVWSYLIKVSANEIMTFPELPEVGDCVDNYSLPQEAKWLIGFWLNRGSAMPKKSRTAYSARTDRAQLNWGRRAKERIASQIQALAGWTITNASYTEAAHEEGTWFIDPPYGDKGKYYRVTFNQFDALGEWCLHRRGLLIAGSFKSSKGRTIEVAYVQTTNTDGSIFHRTEHRIGANNDDSANDAYSGS